MNIFSEIAGINQGASPAVVAGGLIRITRRSSLPAEINRILTALYRGETKIDLGGAVLMVPRSMTVDSTGMKKWTFSPELPIVVTVSITTLQLDIRSLEISQAEGKPAVLVEVSGAIKPNIMFIFDDNPSAGLDEKPKPDAGRVVDQDWDIRWRAVGDAGVPSGKSAEVLKVLEHAQSSGMVVSAMGRTARAGQNRRRACRLEAAAAYRQLQEKKVVGTGIIFWLTVGKWILTALEWLMYLTDRQNALQPGPPK